jgi:hypothetical protein
LPSVPPPLSTRSARRLPVTRTLPKRLAALGWALLFLLNTAGTGLGLHACPYHEGTHRPAGEAPAAAEPGDPHAHHQHHGHDGDGAGDHDHPGSEPCPHFEACQAATCSVLHVALRAGSIATYAVAAETLLLRSGRIAAFHPPFFLPYALAPPARG